MSCRFGLSLILNLFLLSPAFAAQPVTIDWPYCDLYSSNLTMRMY